MALAELSDEQLTTGIREHGSNVAFAKSQGVSEWTIRNELQKRGLVSTARTRRNKGAPRLTRESLHQALLPPNNCKVRAFLDSLDDESREVVEEALGYSKEDFPAASVRDWLIREGFSPTEVPGSDPINDHRAGRRPCRCRG